MTDPTDTDDVAIYSQWPRVGCLRLRPPERNDGTPPAQSHPLASVIRSAFSNSKLRRLELLSWPAAPHQEWVLHPIDSTVQAQPDEDEDLTAPGQTQLPDAGTPTSVTHDEASAATGALESACKEHLVKPYGYGYDRCAVDLSPLEGTIRPTCRLAVRESPDLLPLAQRNPHGVVELISDLNDEDIPYLLQTIISRGDNSTFELSQRLAVYRPNYGLATEHDFAEHLDTGERVDLSTYYDDQTNRIRSNFDLDATRYFDIDTSGDRYEAVSRHKHDVEIIRAARRVLAGRKDCHDLYAGYHDTDKELENLYQYANYYTKIPVDKRTVRAFVALVSDSIKYSPWENVGYIDPPNLITNPVVLPTTADETADPEAASPENVTQYDDGEQSVKLATRGSAEHQLNEDWVVDYFADAGWTVKQLDTEATESVPDIWIQKDEIEYFVEVEHKGTDQPANVLTNAARAAHYDIEVIFVSKNKSKAKSIAKMLRGPVTDTDVHNGAQLYTMSDELTLTDGSTPVLPPDVESSQWYLRYQEPPEAEAEDEDDDDIEARSPSQIEPELRLETPDGEVLAAGSVAESVATWEFEELLRASDPSAADRTKVHGPFVPTQLAYLARSSLRYRNGDQLERLDPNEYPANWNQSDAAGKRERYKNAYETFVDRYTVAVDYTEIEKPDFITPMNERIYKPQTSRKAPGMRESGRALWQFAERKSRDNNALDLIKNRTWRWPHDVTSPDMPFVGHSTVLSELGLEE